MAKAFLKFSDPSATSKLIIVWAAFDTPLSEIGRQVYDPPHPERGLTINNLEPIMHRFSFYYSTDGVALQTFKFDMDIDLTSSDTEITIYDYVINRTGGIPLDPVEGVASHTDTRLIGSTWRMEKRGVGRLRPDEYTTNPATGEWTIINGDVFYDLDTYFAVSEKIVAAGTPISSASDYSVTVLTADTTISAIHYNRLLVCEMPGNVGTITFPAGIPKTKISVSTHGGNQRYTKLAFASAVNFMGLARTSIWLGKSETIELLFTGSAIHVLSYEGEYRRLGALDWSRKAEINTVRLDGALYNIADYPRLYYDFIDKLPALQIKTMTDWALSYMFGTKSEFYNKGFFARDTVAGTFRVPDYRNRYIRALKLLDVDFDATRTVDLPGGFQWDALMEHDHEAINSNSHGGFGKFTTGGDQSEGANLKTLKTGGLENITRNIGLIPSIII